MIHSFWNKVLPQSTITGGCKGGKKKKLALFAHYHGLVWVGTLQLKNIWQPQLTAETTFDDFPVCIYKCRLSLTVRSCVCSLCPTPSTDSTALSLRLRQYHNSANWQMVEIDSPAMSSSFALPEHKRITPLQAHASGVVVYESYTSDLVRLQRDEHVNVCTIQQKTCPLGVVTRSCPCVKNGIWQLITVP